MTDATVQTPPLAEVMTKTESTPPNQPTTNETNKPADTILTEGEAPKEPEAPKGAPETYADFKAPDGVQLDPAVVAEATPLFKELNLTQDQAQKLIDIQTKREAAFVQGAKDAYETTRANWQAEAKAAFGSKLPEVQAEVGKALALIPAEISAPFRQAMDVTGVGDNPAFIKAFYELSKLVNEGRHVPAGAPNVPARPGARPRSAAEAIYGENPA